MHAAEIEKLEQAASKTTSLTASSSLCSRIRGFILANTATQKNRLYVICGIVAFLLLVRFLVIKLAPTGYSEMDCYLSEKEIARMEKLLDVFAEVATEAKFQWWLDYGALLGVIRQGSMMRHDKDVDVSYFEKDRPRLPELDKLLRPHGMRMWGLNVIYSEDYPRMAAGEHELVSCKIDMYGLERLPDGRLIRPDIKKYVVPDQPLSIKDHIWWFLLRWTGVAVFDEKFVFPLSNATMYHYPMSPDPEERKRHWHRTVPVPANPEHHLEVLYGSTWRREIKWKLKCYM